MSSVLFMRDTFRLADWTHRSEIKMRRLQKRATEIVIEKEKTFFKSLFPSQKQKIWETHFWLRISIFFLFWSWHRDTSFRTDKRSKRHWLWRQEIVKNGGREEQHFLGDGTSGHLHSSSLVNISETRRPREQVVLVPCSSPESWAASKRKKIQVHWLFNQRLSGKL
jgi:hypothetical protein